MSKLFEQNGFSVKQGDYIFREGEIGEYLYMIHRGKVKICKGQGQNAKILKILGEREFFGEMALVNLAPRSANAIAVEDSQLIEMSRTVFDAIVKENHHFAIHVIRVLSDRLRETDDLLTNSLEKNRIALLHNSILQQSVSRLKLHADQTLHKIRFEAFMKSFLEQNQWEMAEFMATLDALAKQQSIHYIKDKQGITWIACRGW